MEKKIKILPGGPYEVSEEIPLKQAIIEADAEGESERWQSGKEYEKQQEPYHLCRCGQSEHKPYCDGTHIEIGFEGEETAGHQPYIKGCKVYSGDGVDLLDNENLCASMRFCDRGMTVWQAAIDSADPEAKRQAVEEACNCAAGRLTAVDKEGNAIEPELPQEISPVQDSAAGWRGPLWVKGGIPVEGADGQTYEVRNRVTLCRCGQSSNMPFCDTSHLSNPHMRGHDE